MAALCASVWVTGRICYRSKVSQAAGLGASGGCGASSVEVHGVYRKPQPGYGPMWFCDLRGTSGRSRAGDRPTWFGLGVWPVQVSPCVALVANGRGVLQGDDDAYQIWWIWHEASGVGPVSWGAARTFSSTLPLASS